MVYLLMSYLYGIWVMGKLMVLIVVLKLELYVEVSYDLINWNIARNACAKEDLYYLYLWI